MTPQVIRGTADIAPGPPDGGFEFHRLGAAPRKIRNVRAPTTHLRNEHNDMMIQHDHPQSTLMAARASKLTRRL